MGESLVTNEVSPTISISIVLPVFNEEERILDATRHLLSYCRQEQWDFELIFVEDGSTDSTISLLKELMVTEPSIRLLSLPEHVGKGGSIKAAALYVARKEYMIYMDVDLAAGPAEIKRLLEYIDSNDVVIGSRIVRGDLPPIKRPILRSLFSHFYSRLFRMLFRMPIHDPQCGFKMFRRHVVPQLFSEVSIHGFAFDTELIVRAFCQGLRVKEVPIIWEHGARSKVNILHEVYIMGSDILLLWYFHHLLWKQNRATYPFKKGSLLARVMFKTLSFWLSPKLEDWISEIKVPELKSEQLGNQGAEGLSPLDESATPKELQSSRKT
jgi:glycosyltransferase involved in cell wall biosynthesis